MVVELAVMQRVWQLIRGVLIHNYDIFSLREVQKH